MAAATRSDLMENLKKAEVLKEKSLSCQNINSLDVWTNQRKLLNIYEEILMLDLELALDKKVEQDLWNYCFKNYIALLQASAKHNKMGGAGCCAKLSWLLECASGFYLSLLQQICTVFSLDLPFNRRCGVYGILEDGERDRWRGVVSQPSKDSCYYVCQYCLVHLGDIARYRNQSPQAHAFYKQAVGVGAWSGQPYNQLGLLGATDPDRLSTVFYYMRSIAAPRPFHNALTNLTNTLAKSLVSMKDEDSISEDNAGVDGSSVNSNGGKISVVEYETLLLKLLALIHSGRTGQEAREVLGTLNSALTPLIATQQFSSYRLMQMCAVSIWMFESGGSSSESTAAGSSEALNSRTSIEDIMSEYISGLLSSLLLPLYTSAQESILSYFALAPVKVILCWLECKPSVVVKLSRVSVWRGLCKLLNDLRAANPNPPPQVANDALPEDHDLRGFLPLDKALHNLNFEGEELDVNVERRLRGFRLLKLGETLSLSSPNNPIYQREGNFEVVPASSETGGGCTTSSQHQKPLPGGATQHEMGRSRIRQNVALQSIMRLSNTPQMEWDARAGSSVLSEDARWWPPGPPVEEVPGWTGGTVSEPPLQNQEGRMYSLFSGGGDGQISTASSLAPSILRHQSLWSGPGPSPLERLLQQQKNQRSGSGGNHAHPDT